MITFQRAVQTGSLAVFAGLLVYGAASPVPEGLPADAFLRMDPAAGGAAMLAARAWIAGFWPAAALLCAGLLAGRVFCGYLCPLGATVDLSDALQRAGKRAGKAAVALPAHLFRLKYHLLCAVLLASALGVSLAWLISPIPLATRLYGLTLFPVLARVADGGLALFSQAGEWAGGLLHASVKTQRFAGQWYTVFFFAAVFAAARLSPRFWCRYLCPAGAVFALFSRRPLVRRRVSDACIECGVCAKKCPMRAIPKDAPRATHHAECIACETCARVCPVSAVAFGMRAPAPAEPPAALPSPSRRHFLASGAAGAGAALVTLSGLDHPAGMGGAGSPMPPSLIRPPGAVTEARFLALCLRCGECMKACPTNTLQPLGLAAGFSGLFSPVVTPRRGACEPLCTACGEVCPTGALRALPPPEKLHAKVGTAYIMPYKCLAWEFGQQCLVCDEVCPFDAVSLKQIPDHTVAVPVVDESRCFGCGYCEYHCPVQAAPAIVVEPMAAIRLDSGSHRAEAKARGYTLRVKGGGGAEKAPPAKAAPGGLPPGFTE